MIENELEDSPATLLHTLQAELEFLERGGYHLLAPKWYAPLIFEDGPHSAQYEDNSEFPLLEFVPPKDRHKPNPWRHIVLNNAGETLATLYRTATQQEIEEHLRKWLNHQICEIKGSFEEVLGEVELQAVQVGQMELAEMQVVA